MDEKDGENVEQSEPEEHGSCCGRAKGSKKGKGFLSGLIYGLVPHTGCIAFIVFTILGVTTATSFFRPLLMNRYFFHILILLSFIFATISAAIYLRKHKSLSMEGIKRKKRYLTILYGTSIGINVLLFMIIFPLAANMTGATGAVVAGESISQMTLKVDIPCPGHAPLISESLKTLSGVKSVTYRFPNYFDVSYSPSESPKSELLSLDVFGPYPAEVIEETQAAGTAANYEGDEQTTQTTTEPAPQGCGSCGGCSGACGGYCTV